METTVKFRLTESDIIALREISDGENMSSTLRRLIHAERARRDRKK
jgi:hypothetical protein